jgi:hypothetical protein
MRGRSLAWVVMVLMIPGLAACGSEDDIRSSASGVGPLLDRVPGEANAIITMDMAAAKRELGIAADTDPKRYRARQGTGTPEARFDNAALKIVGYVTGVGRTPIADAIDHGAITAAVHALMVGAGGELKIYRTSQSRASLDAGLRKAGLREASDDVYVVEKPQRGASLTAAALGDDGLVVAGETAAVVSGVARRAEPDPRLAPMRRMLDLTRGSLRAVQSHVELRRDEAPCVLRVAGGALLTPGDEDEDLVLELRGEPRASDVVLGTSTSRREYLYRDYRVSDVSREGQLLKLKVRTPPGSLANENAVTISQYASDLDLLYRCPGAGAAKARAQTQARRDKLPDPAPPDRSGSDIETAVSGYIAAGSLAPPPAVKVRCPLKSLPRSLKVLRCTGTRRYKGRLYHYTIKVNLKYPRIDSLDIDSPDDKTGQIVSEDDRSSTRGN